MKLNNKGFALTSIIYMLIVLFLMIILLVLENLATRKIVLDKIKNNVKIELNQGGKTAPLKYIVTFDPTGGELAQTEKEVEYNKPYGELPIPTREGYTFVGWRGKNIIDKSQSTKEVIQNETPFSSWASQVFDNNWVVNNINPNTIYSVSYDIEGISVPEYDSKYSGNLGLLLYSLDSDKTTYPSKYLMTGYWISVGEQYHYSGSFTTPSNVNLAESKYVLYAYSNRYLKNDVGVLSTIRLYNLQLEEGDTSTEYEPYQEYTSNTIVTKQENHTLYAIWQKN